MGTILKGFCKNCSYETADLYFGGGFMNFTTSCSFPGIDKVKGVVKMKNILEKDKVQKRNQNFIFYDSVMLIDKDLKKTPDYIEWGEFKLHKEGNFCPRCSKFSLEFLEIGNWD